MIGMFDNRAYVAILLYLCASFLCSGRRRIFSVLDSKNDHFNSSYESRIHSLHRKLLSSIRLRDPEDHRVHTLPGLTVNDIVNYAGHLTIDEKKGGNIFYWLFEHPQNSKEAPFIIWLNGGPGCSSMDGLFLEIGPYKLNSGNSKDFPRVELNPYSWHKVANLLIVDQPVETGLSFVNSRDGLANSDQAVNEQFYKFLIAFFQLHKRFLSFNSSIADADGISQLGYSISRKIFLAGESHAGHYIPHMAAFIRKKNQEIIKNNQRNDNPSFKIMINLEGVALGNPWIDPINQYDVSTYAHAFGLITSGQKRTLKELNKECQHTLRKGKYNSAVCLGLLDKVIESSSLGGNAAKVSMYDIRKYLSKANEFPPGHEDVEKYLNQKNVREAIHATAKPGKFVECADPPFYALSHLDGQGVTTQLKNELNSGLKVLLFSGQYDIVCNHLGSEYTLSRLDWNGRASWLSAQRGIWVVDGLPAGYIKSYQNLQYLLVLNSGHMVPMDQPKASLDMIQRFINSQKFSSGAARIQMHGVLKDDLDFSAPDYQSTFVDTPTENSKPLLHCDEKLIDAGSSGGSKYSEEVRDVDVENSEDSHKKHNIRESIFHSYSSETAVQSAQLSHASPVEYLTSTTATAATATTATTASATAVPTSSLPENLTTMTICHNSTDTNLCSLELSLILGMSDSRGPILGMSDSRGPILGMSDSHGPSPGIGSWLHRVGRSPDYDALLKEILLHDVVASIVSRESTSVSSPSSANSIPKLIIIPSGDPSHDSITLLRLQSALDNKEYIGIAIIALQSIPDAVDVAVNISSPNGQSRILATVLLQGTISLVQNVVTLLDMQAQDDTSPLKQGLLTANIISRIGVSRYTKEDSSFLSPDGSANMKYPANNARDDNIQLFDWLMSSWSWVSNLVRLTSPSSSLSSSSLSSMSENAIPSTQINHSVPHDVGSTTSPLADSAPIFMISICVIGLLLWLYHHKHKADKFGKAELTKKLPGSSSSSSGSNNNKPFMKSAVDSQRFPCARIRELPGSHVVYK